MLGVDARQTGQWERNFFFSRPLLAIDGRRRRVSSEQEQQQEQQQQRQQNKRAGRSYKLAAAGRLRAPPIRTRYVQGAAAPVRRWASEKCCARAWSSQSIRLAGGSLELSE